MSGFRDSGGGGNNSFGNALGGIANAASSGVKNVAKSATKKPKKPMYSGPTAGVNNISKGIKNIAKNSYGNNNRNRNNYSNSASNSGYRPAQPPRIVTPRPPVGNTPTGQIAKSVPPPAPAPISIEDYLAKDTAFNSQKNAYQKALADYAAQMAAEQGKYNGEYDAQAKQLGLDRTEGLTNLKDDYASRGLIQSGVYADAMGDLNKKFDTSQADLERAKQAYMSDLTTGQQNFSTTQQTLLEKARQDALNRRLDSLKV